MWRLCFVPTCVWGNLIAQIMILVRYFLHSPFFFLTFMTFCEILITFIFVFVINNKNLLPFFEKN